MDIMKNNKEFFVNKNLKGFISVDSDSGTIIPEKDQMKLQIYIYIHI